MEENIVIENIEKTDNPELMEMPEVNSQSILMGTMLTANSPYNIQATVNPSGSGTVTGTGSYGEGSAVSLQATPNSGYDFKNWTLKEYTQLEYIESSGTQAINTNVIAKNTVRTIVNFSLNSGFSFSNSSYVFGVYDNNAYSVSVPSITTYRYSYVTSSFQNVTVDNIGYNQKHNIDFSNGNFKYDGTNIATPNLSNCTHSLILFARHNNNTIEGFSKIRIYDCSIYDGNILLLKFIPVIRHSDGAIGLLDLVNLKFYDNNGTGEFIGGNAL